MRYISQGDVNVSDGTFETAPRHYYQHYIIHAALPGSYHYFPCVFAFCSSKLNQHHSVLNIFNFAIVTRKNRRNISNRYSNC
jgi:hypothetical protein